MSIDSSSKAALHKGYKHWCPEVEPREDWDKDFNFVLIRSIEELKKLDVEHKFVAWDTETSGLNPDIDWLVGFSFSFDGKTGYYVPVKHDDIALGKEALDIFFSILSKAGTQFLYNCRFDQRFFEAAGYSLEGLRYYDVMNAIWLADTNVLMPSLKASERRFLGWIPKTFSETLGDATTFQHVPAEDAYKYACLDEHELVMMGDRSTKRICEVEVGDMVCTPKGPRKVTAVYNNGIRECYSLVWNDGSATTATGNHKFLFHDKDTGEEVWRSVDEVYSLYQKDHRSSLEAVQITPKGKHSDFLLCEVSKFRPCVVYDIQVEEVHCFVMANGIISHNCTDALGTYHLALISNQFYKESYPASKYDNDALYPMMRLENTPQRLDLEYLKSLCSSVETRIDESLQQVYQLAGCTFNVNSPAQFGKIMLERFGVDTGVRTPTGAMKADLKTLEAWMVKHGSKASPEVKDFLSAYKEYKKTVKFKSSYLDKYIKAAEDSDTFPIRFSYKFQSVPCLTENNTVLTKSRGFVSIKDVQSDDMIWTAWGYKRVLWNHSHEVAEFYRVILKNGMTLEGTGHHPVLVRKSPLEKVEYSGMTKDDVEWAGIQDLKPDEPVVINHTNASLSCQDSWRSSLARIMGYFYGHGRMTDGEMMSLIFDNPDLSYHYAGWMKSLFGDEKVFQYDLGKGKVEYSITRQTLAKFLVEHDVIPAFDEDCFWRLDPMSTYIEEAYRISRMPDTFRHFLVGYLDSAKTSVRDLWYRDIPDDWADGVTKDRVVFVIPSSCKDVIIPMFWASAIGCKVTDYTFKIGFCEDKVTRVEVSDPYSLSNLLSLWNNQDVGLARFSCVELPKTFRLYSESRVQSVERVPTKNTVYDIEVEGVHEFVAGGIVTHNTGRLSCLSHDALVHTRQGLVPIVDITEEHDIEVSPNKFAKAKLVHTGEQDFVKIVMSSGKKIECTTDHRFLCPSDEGFVWRYARDLKVSDMLCRTPVTFKGCDINFEMFLYGFFLGDGSYYSKESKNKYSLRMFFCEKDHDAMMYIHDGLVVRGIPHSMRPCKDSLWVIEFAKEGSRRLSEMFPVENVKQSERRVDFSYIHSKVDAFSVLAGVYQAEGEKYIRPDDGKMHSALNVTSYALVQSLQRLADYVGIRTKIHTIKIDHVKHPTHHKQWRLQFCVKSFRKYLDNSIPFRINTKKDVPKFLTDSLNNLPKDVWKVGERAKFKALYHNKRYSLYSVMRLCEYSELPIEVFDYEQVVSIEPCGKKEAYTLAVDDPLHRYIAEGFIHHNCGGDKKNSFFTQNNVQCLEEDTSVITSEGIKPIKQVNTGDLVWTGAEFASCQQLGSKTCSVLKISTDCGEVVCSAEHLVLASDSRHGIGEFRHAGDLKVGQFVKHVGNVLSSDEIQSKFSYGNVYNPKGGVPRKEIHVDKILHDFWFSLGFFLGDGNFLRDKTGGYRGIAISVGHQDVDNIPRIQAGFKEVGIDTCIRTLKKKECFDVTSVYTKSQNLTDLFLDLDFGTNAFTKKVPSVVFRLGDKQRSLFLRGLFSSDGCCNTGVSYTSVSYTLVSEVRKLLWTFGISSRISPRKDTEAYTLYVHDKEKFFEYVGFEGERRKSNVRNKSEFRLDDDGYSPARIERIESVGEAICYDLFVPKFERFVANGFIVHNSTPKPHSLMVKGRKATQEEINQGKDILGWYLSNDIPDDEAVGLVEGMDPDHFNLRRAFLPKDDDCYVVSIDMKAEELRLVANIYNEKTWADAFIHGKDVHKACYSPDTEFLVLDRGWMTADRITKGMKIAYYDPMDDEVRFTKAGERYSHEASEVYTHPTLFNVTDNHRMWIGTQDAGFRIVRASELKSQGSPKQKFRMKTAVGQRKSFQSIESHFGRKLGQYFCYGFMYFAPHYYDEEGFVHITLDSPCTKIPHDFALFLHSGDFSSTEFSVDRELSLGLRSLEAFNPCTSLFSLAKTKYKDEPIFLQDFVYGMLVYLSSTKFNTLNLGDGSKVSGKVVVSSKEHADAIQWLLMLTGSTCRVDPSKSSLYGEGAYVLTIFSDVSSLPKSLGSTFGSVKQKNIAEKHLTYSCFSVPSGLLVTRYKGQITVNGNTAIKLFGEENYSKEARKKAKCVAGDTILHTAEDHTIAIRDLVSVETLKNAVIGEPVELPEPKTRISTPDGWSPVTHWISNGKKDTLKLIIERQLTLEVTPDHLVGKYDPDASDDLSKKYKLVRADSLSVGHYVLWDYCPMRITDIQKGSSDVYDITVDNASHTFHANGVVVHNCASFGILYGSGAQGFNNSFPDMTLDECRQFLAKFKEALPSIEQGQAENVAYAREHGTINTGYGRQRRVRSYFQSGDRAQVAFAERTVKNSVVQGTAADVLKLIFCRLWANVFKPYPDVTFMSTIHDEVNFSMPKRLAREVIPICMECMTIRRDDWPVTLECSLSIGRDSLGDLIPFTYNKETKEFTPEWEESSEVLKKRTGHVETESSDNESLDVEESDDPYFGLPPEACEF